jgi:membrane-associated phospholipid phosphatase
MMNRRIVGIAAVLGMPVLSACGTLPSGDRWGERATYRPGWAAVKESAVNAARDPWVWGPLVGAAVFQIDDWDRHTSDWAREHTPVFGSNDHAEQWSDDLRTASVIAHYATILATPDGEDPGDWLIGKAKGTLVGVAAVASTVAVTRTLKTAVDRERPNGEDDESFPSGHTSTSAVHTRLASRNLQAIDMPKRVRRSLDVGLYALTIGTSWARIEAGWHYPSDTLFSMALGNFIGAFVNDAFMGVRTADLAMGPTPQGDGYMVSWQQAF